MNLLEFYILFGIPAILFTFAFGLLYLVKRNARRIDEERRAGE